MKCFDPISRKMVSVLPAGKKKKQKKLWLDITGSDNPCADLKSRAYLFWQKHSQEITQAETLVRTGTKRRPSRTREGLGVAWLEAFSGYADDQCLLFPFRTVATPRGIVIYNYKSMPAHRAMCLMVHKLPPAGKPMALHRCGNGHLGCVNPNHLYWGDASDNGKDAHQHRRHGKPDASGPKAGPPKWARVANR